MGTRMTSRRVGVGIIGGGLMGRELASAIGRWHHLTGSTVRPHLAAVCDIEPSVLTWYGQLQPAPRLTAHVQEILDDPAVEVVYCAVPHHLHADLYIRILRAGKHLLGEKPFGIDRDANTRIGHEIEAHPELLVRCSSEMPFYPGGQRVFAWLAGRGFGRVLEVRSYFLHSSDLDPNKAVNWKRRAATNGEYGCMGDLGMHAMHLPLRMGWRPRTVHAALSNIVTTRPDGRGGIEPCDTWDNAVLLGEAEDDGHPFPLRIETKRIAPGHKNTWSIEVDGTAGSISYSTKHPKTLRVMDYRPGGEQAWQTVDLGAVSAYPTITGEIFETGFSDALLQMWAAYFDELEHGRDGMRQPFHCATPHEAAATHDVFTAALESHAKGTVAAVPVPVP
jgi:predicted dehydrogenase